MPIKTVPDRMLDLPIFHKAYDFIIVCSEYTAKFPKKDRYALGVKIENASLDFLMLVMRANYGSGALRENLLGEASITLDMLKVLVRIAKDKKSIQPNQYFILEERLQDVGRQLGGWIRFLSTKKPA